MAGNDSYTKLLIHSDTTDGSVVFDDSSASDHVITPFGDIHHSVDHPVFGNTAIQLDGAGDYLTIPDSSDWDFGTGDLTIDFRVRSSDWSTNPHFYVQGDYTTVLSDFALLMRYHTTNGFSINYSSNGTTDTDVVFAWSPAIDTYYHVAVVVTSGVLRVFIDGTQIGSDHTMLGAIYDSSRHISLGVWDVSFDGGSLWAPLIGDIDEIRISKGIARWTSNFTPPTEAYTNPLVGSIITITSGFGLGVNLEAESDSIIEIVSGFGLGVDVNLYQESYSIINIASGFGLGITLESESNKAINIAAGFGLGAGVVVQTKSINNVTAGFGLGASVSMVNESPLDIVVGFGLVASTSVVSSLPVAIKVGFGLGTSVALDNVPAFMIKAGFGLGTSVQIAREIPMSISAGFGFGSSVLFETEGVTCSIPSHDSTRWS